MTTVTAAELTALVGVSVDGAGLRFEHEGRTLRAVRGADAAFFRGLLASPGLEGLFAAGLVRFRESDVVVEGFDLVLEADRVPVVSFPQEWPTAMLREAGLMTARLGRALAAIGAGLQDAHPWNVLFDGTRAIWVDLGSLAPMSRVDDAWIREFRRHVVLPLELRRRGWHALADAAWRDHPGTGVKALFERRRVRVLFPFGFARLARGTREPGPFFEHLEAFLAAGDVPARTGEWSGYRQPTDDPAAYDAKQRAVAGFLGGAPAGRVLDVGANAGWYSELAARQGHDVVALDTDDVALGRLFARTCETGLPILPLRMDAMWPTGSHGLLLAYPPATERLCAPISLWLAVVHHLVGRQHLSFDIVARAIDRFTGDLAIVEFIPREDVHVSRWPIASEPWYDADHFIAAMRPYFPVVERAPSHPDPRIMLAFRRR